MFSFQPCLHWPRLCPKVSRNTTQRNHPMRRVPSMLPVVIALALACAVGQAARAETVFTKKITYFQIGGKTADDLDRELERRGPYTSSTGLRHPGATKIKFGGDITYAEQNGRCRIQSARVTVSAQIILPKWKNRRKPPPASVWCGIRCRAISSVTRNAMRKLRANMRLRWKRPFWSRHTPNMRRIAAAGGCGIGGSNRRPRP